MAGSPEGNADPSAVAFLVGGMLVSTASTMFANPAVTCAIPGTGKPDHMRDNLQAGFGSYPDAALLKRMIAETGV